MLPINELRDHIILCEWNTRMKEVHRALREDVATTTLPLVLITDSVDDKPVKDPNMHFVKGHVTEKNLKRAGIFAARTIVIMGDDRIESQARDARVVLLTLTVETMHRAIYSIVEIANRSNVIHARHANADEIIVTSDLSSALISRAVVDHGASAVVSDLLSSQEGNVLRVVPAPLDMIGKRFIEAFTALKKDRNITILGIQKDATGKVIHNPKGRTKIVNGDYLIIVTPLDPRQTVVVGAPTIEDPAEPPPPPPPPPPPDDG